VVSAKDPDLIAGVATASWGLTLADEDDFHFLLLPRLPLVAEKAWSLAAHPWSEPREHLARHTGLWEHLGLSWFADHDIPWAADRGPQSPLTSS
jgi:hexosaminidase